MIYFYRCMNTMWLRITFKGLVISKSPYVAVHAIASVKIIDETIVENMEPFAVLGSSAGPSSERERQSFENDWRSEMHWSP